MLRPAAKLGLGILYVCALIGWNSLCSMLSTDTVAGPTERRVVPARNATEFRIARKLAMASLKQIHGDRELPPTRARAPAKTWQEGAPVAAAGHIVTPAAATAPTSVKVSGDAHVATEGDRAHQGAEGGCPARRPYHTILTAQATVYQQWQSRIMYYHWKKQAAAGGPCSDMSGFTRLVASEGAKPDGLEAEMPSVFVKQMTPEELARPRQPVESALCPVRGQRPTRPPGGSKGPGRSDATQSAA